MSRPILSRPTQSPPDTAPPEPGGEAPRVGRAGRVIDLRGAEKIRYQRMITVLSLFTRLAFGAALGGLLLPDPVGPACSAAAVTIVIAAPLIRVAWLAVRWYLRGDRRYAAVATSLLLVVGTGSVVALVTR